MLLNFKNWCISIQCKSCCLKSLKIDFFRKKKFSQNVTFFAIQVIFLQQPLNLTAPAYSIWNTDTFRILFKGTNVQKRRKKRSTSIRDRKKHQTNYCCTTSWVIIMIKYTLMNQLFPLITPSAIWIQNEWKASTKSGPFLWGLLDG